MNATVSTAHAVAMIQHFQSEKETMLAPKYQWTNIFPRCVTFEKKVLEEMLAAENCNYISFYPAMDEKGKIQLIAAGAAMSTDNILSVVDPAVV